MDGNAPPPYVERASAPPPNAPVHPTFDSLPEHLLLSILTLLPLPTLSRSVRPTSRHLHLLADCVLRPALLPVWESKVRSGYSSDALGKRWRGRGIEGSKGRELAVLDLFVAACAQEAARAHESELHLLPSASTSAERDIFELLQPRARVEDLVVRWGAADGLIEVRGASEKTPKDGESTILAADVTVALTGRTAKLLLPFQSASEKGVRVPRTVVEVGRNEGETLEVVASALVAGLEQGGIKRFGGDLGWYTKT